MTHPKKKIKKGYAPVYLGALNMKTGEARFVKPTKASRELAHKLANELSTQPQQKECDHDFKETDNGYYCFRCGQRLNRKEYQKLKRKYEANNPTQSQQEKQNCKNCKWHKIDVCVRFNSPDLINLTTTIKDNQCSEFEFQPQQEEWVEDFDRIFTIDDGILCMWERVLPDGDWEGRTAEIKDIKQFIKNLISEIRKQERERIIKEIQKLASTNADSGWYDKAVQDILELIKKIK